MVSESEIASHGEVDLPMPLQGQHHQQQSSKAQCGGGAGGGASLGHQSSIYSLTLDEFQHTLCEGGKNFGSMNMDEFLNSIWTAEENQQAGNTTHHSNALLHHHHQHHNNNAATELSLRDSSAAANRPPLSKQPSLKRQGSLTLSAPLCRKTVEEVWSEIHNQQSYQQHHHHQNDNAASLQNHGSTARQPTFGEMTLEDFLIKAGVVQGQASTSMAQPQQFGMFQNSNARPPVGPAGATFVTRPVMGFGAGAPPASNVPAYQTMPPTAGAGMGDAASYGGNNKGPGVYPPAPPPVCYGGRVGNGSNGGYGPSEGTLALASPVSPVSSDGMCHTDGGNQYGGLDMGGLRGGRKRIIDGPVEKVVERRQRRMIKNRESAARSRARKQAYTVELEAELNQLREENAHLKQALAELERKQDQKAAETNSSARCE